MSNSSSSTSINSDNCTDVDNKPPKRRPATQEETTIRKWLTNLFTHSIMVGERFLADGHLATAASVFANATLLSERAELFAAAVQQVYPCYFYHLYKQRMLIMGYAHLFPNAEVRTVGVYTSQSDGLRQSSSDDICHTGPSPIPPPSPSTPPPRPSQRQQ